MDDQLCNRLCVYGKFMLQSQYLRACSSAPNGFLSGRYMYHDGVGGPCDDYADDDYLYMYYIVTTLWSYYL